MPFAVAMIIIIGATPPRLHAVAGRSHGSGMTAPTSPRIIGAPRLRDQGRALFVAAALALLAVVRIWIALRAR
jgi:hypothetical protein